MDLRRLIARIRRRGTLRVALVPTWQLQPLASPFAAWRATGADPQFACRTPAYPLRGGWYKVDLDFEPLDDRISAPRLYFDFGEGLSEKQSISLNFVKPSATRHSGIVLLPRDTTAVRFDPAITRCEFRTRRLRLRKISRLGAAVAMLRDIRSRRFEASDGAAWLRFGVGKLFARGGVSAFATWLYALYRDLGAEQQSYERWLTLFDKRQSPGDAAANAKRTHPTFSIVLPTFETPERWLRRCLDSVLAQTWPHWELCIADDASTRPQVRSVLAEYAARDARIRVVNRPSRGHISAASNSALVIARGDFVALLDHDDEYHPEALQTIADAIRDNPQWKLVYTDEDKIDAHGARFDPYFKPDWNPDLLHGHNFVNHLAVYERALLQSVGGFREGLEGSQDWDLVFRCSERLDAAEIGHVPRVLYHWRAIPGSTAIGVGEKSYAHVSGQRAIREHLARVNARADVLEVDGVSSSFRVRYKLPTPLPLVSIIVPTRDHVGLLRQCIESIVTRTTYANVEIVIVDNQSSEPETLAYFASLAANRSIRILPHDQPFNYSRINNAAVAACKGSIVCLLNNDIEVITPDWLEEMVGQASRREVGAVGAMLYYPNDTIQHAGVVTGIGGVASHAYCGMQRGHPGNMGRARLVQGMTAVTAACLVVRRDVYEQVGGLDESLAVAFNDVDFCLRVAKAGYRNLWTPFAELYHHESASRGYEDTPEKQERFEHEMRFMRERWDRSLDHDASYNLNFTLHGDAYTLAFPPRDPPATAKSMSRTPRSGRPPKVAPARESGEILTPDLVLDRGE